MDRTGSPRRIKTLPLTVILLGIVSLLNDLSSEIIYPILPIFLTQALGASATALGLVEGAAESVASLMQVGSGIVSDRLARRRPLVLFGYALAACVRPLLALSTAVWHVLVLRVVDRIGKGIRGAPRDALIAETVAAEMRGYAFGFHRGMDNLGAAFGPLVATLLLSLTSENLRLVLFLGALPAVLSLVPLLRVSETGHRDKPVSQRGSPARPARGFFVLLTAIVLFTLGNASDAFLLLRSHQLGLSPAAVPLLWLMFNLIRATLSTTAGKLSDRLGHRRMMILGWMLYALVYAGFALASDPFHAIVLFAIYGLYYATSEPAERALIAEYASSSSRATAYSLYRLASGIAALPASVVFGILWDRLSPAAAFGFGAAMAILGLGVLVLQTYGRTGSMTRAGQTIHL